MDLSSLQGLSPLQTVLGGGIIMSITSVLMTKLSSIPGLIWTAFYKRITVNLDIDNSTSAFKHCLEYINDNHAGKFRSYSTIHTSTFGDKYKFSLGYSPFWFWHKLKPVRVVRSSKDPATASENMRRMESLSLTFFTMDKSAPRKFMDGLSRRLTEEGKRNRRYNINGADYWIELGSLPHRSPESLSYADGVLEKVIDDIRRFKDNENWYTERGIPYQRGILLVGPPGTGKSSLINCIATIFDMDVFSLNFSAEGTSDRELMRLLACTTNDSDNPLIMIEDIDRIRVGGAKGVTQSGLLNALSGVYQTRGRLVIASTNHLENLDPALIRPGRFDIIIEIGYATAEQVSTYLSKYYGEAIKVDHIPDNVTMAYVQECCIGNIDKNAAIASIMVPRNDTPRTKPVLPAATKSIPKSSKILTVKKRGGKPYRGD